MHIYICYNILSNAQVCTGDTFQYTVLHSIKTLYFTRAPQGTPGHLCTHLPKVKPLGGRLLLKAPLAEPQNR